MNVFLGIARAFTYGGRRNSPIWIPDLKPRDSRNLSKEEYMNTDPSKSNTINHFFEKVVFQ